MFLVCVYIWSVTQFFPHHRLENWTALFAAHTRHLSETAGCSLLPLRDVRECKMLFVAPTGCQKAQDAFCCPNWTSIRECSLSFCCPHRKSESARCFFVAPTGCHSESTRCFVYLLPPWDVIWRMQNTFSCPHRTSFRECKMLFVACRVCHSKSAR